MGRGGAHDGTGRERNAEIFRNAWGICTCARRCPGASQPPDRHAHAVATPPQLPTLLRLVEGPKGGGSPLVGSSFLPQVRGWAGWAGAVSGNGGRSPGWAAVERAGRAGGLGPSGGGGGICRLVQRSHFPQVAPNPGDKGALESPTAGKTPQDHSFAVAKRQARASGVNWRAGPTGGPGQLAGAPIAAARGARLTIGTCRAHLRALRWIATLRPSRWTPKSCWGSFPCPQTRTPLSSSRSSPGEPSAL